MSRRDLRLFLAAALVCAATQLVVAYANDRSLETPNLSTEVAQRLAATGVYGADAWVYLRGSSGPGPIELVRAYQLPGEPLYLAAAFRWLPAWTWRALHVPVVVMLVLAVGATSRIVGGSRMAALAMAIVALDPFIVWHGPVWDDTMLGAVLEWTVVAAVVSALNRTTARRRPAVLALSVGAIAGWAGVTRASSFFALALMSIVVLAWPRLRAARLPAGAALGGLLAGKIVWGLRNLLVIGVFFTGATDTGLAIWRANAASARHSLWTTGVTEDVSDAEIAPLYARAADLDEMGADRMYRHATLRRVLEAPLDCVTTALLKLAASLSGVNLSKPLLGLSNAFRAAFNVGLLWAGLLAWWRWPRGQMASTPQAGAAMAALCLAGVTLAMLAVGTVGLRYRLDVGVAAAIGAASLLAPRFGPRA